MAVVLALVSASAYGLSDFLGGIFSRRAAAWPIAVVGQSSTAVCAGLLSIVLGGTVTGGDWAWGGAAGVGGGIGAAFLYRGLAAGRMSVVAPISALGSAIVPVAVGLVTGDRPTVLAWAGIAAALPAIYLISRVSDEGDERGGLPEPADLEEQQDVGAGADARTRLEEASEHPPTTGDDDNGILDGVLAGVGFGSLFAMLGQVGSDAGLYPLVLTQVTSVLAIIATATLLRSAWVPRGRAVWRAAMMGPLGASATGAFLYATHSGMLTIVSVIAALYPALTVVLATVVLREHIHGAQAVGLALAAAAVSLVAAG